jgi:prophage tail gpP-like protein
LLVDGEEYAGTIKSVQVTASIEQVAHFFTVETFVARGAPFPFYAFAKAQLYDGDRLLVDGYLEQPDDSRSSDGSTVTLTGKSRTNHLQEASAALDTLQLRNVTLEKIVRKLVEPWKIPVKVTAGVDQGKPFKKFRLNDGETPFEAMARAVHERGLLIYTETGAEVIIGEPTRGPALFVFPDFTDVDTMIRTGGDISGLGSQYSVTGHGTHMLLGKDPGKAIATVLNPEITEHRPIIIQAQTGTQFKELVKQAERIRQSRMGKALTCNVETAAWYGRTGQIWWPNQLIHLRADVHVGKNKTLDEEMVLSTVYLRFSSDEGSSSQLEFKRRDAFLTEGK